MNPDCLKQVKQVQESIAILKLSDEIIAEEKKKRKKKTKLAQTQQFVHSFN